MIDEQTAPLKITAADFPLLREFIEQQCGIVLRDSQKYLLESRLTKLVRQNQCNTFMEFYQLAKANRIPGLREKIVNAMTTNETLWFRDSHPWQNFAATILPDWEQQLLQRPEKKRIWSAASSTGQEAYSISMIIDAHIRKNPHSALFQNVEIIGTDISTSALYVAIAGNYDEIAMSRGFSTIWQEYKQTYFVQHQRVWEISPHIRKMARFIRFNLQESFSSLGKFDLICLRNVIIYFSDEFKRELFEKMAQCLTPGGYLLLGASETPIRYTSRFKTVRLDNSTYYQLKE